MKNCIKAVTAVLMLSASLLAHATSSTQANQKPLNVFYLQSADKAIISPTNVEKGIYTLIFKNTKPAVAYFSNRPNRIIGQSSMNDFIKHWQIGSDSFSKDAPNAVLNGIINKKAKKLEFVNIMMELSKPQYDAFSKTMYYQIHILQNSSEQKNVSSLDHVTLFIDDACLTCIGGR